jgi:hypothetical protein
LLRKRGLRDQMVEVLMRLDVWLDKAPSLDEDFWGLLRSEIGRTGLSCDDLPGPRGSGPVGGSGGIVVLSPDNLATVLEATRSALDLWMMRGHSKERTLEIGFAVSKGEGMERAEVRGPAQSIKDALAIGKDGFSEVGRSP